MYRPKITIPQKLVQAAPLEIPEDITEESQCPSPAKKSHALSKPRTKPKSSSKLCPRKTDPLLKVLMKSTSNPRSQIPNQTSAMSSPVNRFGKGFSHYFSVYNPKKGAVAVPADDSRRLNTEHDYATRKTVSINSRKPRKKYSPDVQVRQPAEEQV